MNTRTIRRRFIEYFKQRKHTLIPSSSVVPHDDPTLLFINAGMNQFKDVFLGEGIRDYQRAVTAQKCVRVGGKHNDLENVGHTKRHLTFFEMLGNFSFGDYFKKEAIRFAWEVSTEIFGFEPDRLWPSVYHDDDEAFELWTNYVPAERITRLGEKDNFWAMGDTGPCGPCSEIYYDRGPGYGDGTNIIEDVSQERFLEFWNLVFMQYNRLSDGNWESLPKPSIDTGSGIERVMLLIQEVDSVFETDLLRSLIKGVEEVAKKHYDPADHETAPAFRVIADHLRTLAFAIADGAQPSNIERGYVLRKVLRRAVRYGRQLGMNEPFLGSLLPFLIEEMGEDYPEIVKGKERIVEILYNEEEAFIRTLKRGGNLLNQIIHSAHNHANRISGEEAFKLKDTYGFPIEEILLIAKDAGLHVEMERYESLEQEARERSKQARKEEGPEIRENVFADFVEKHGSVLFTGYQEKACEGKILGILKDNTLVDSLGPNEQGMVILDKTPFYAEMGGQVGDSGSITAENVLFEVFDAQSPYKGVIVHHGKLIHGELKVGMSVTAAIDVIRRRKIANNHTATHLLHWALHEVLGEHVQQAGSVVDPRRLRFDFNHHKALTPDEIKQIEDLVNAKIRENRQVGAYEIPYEQAQGREDIRQFFGEKYGSVVRVIDIDAISKELCGGTHTSQVGNIGYFRILKETGIAAGVRRIEAATGEEAEAFARSSDSTIQEAASLLKIPAPKLLERLEKLIKENQELSKEIKARQKDAMYSLSASIAQKCETVGSIRLVIEQLSIPSKELKEYVDEVSNRIGSGVVVLAAASEGKGLIMIKVSDDLVGKGINAREMIDTILPLIGGGGGGKPQLAQGGGPNVDKINEALESIRTIVRERQVV